MVGGDKLNTQLLKSKRALKGFTQKKLAELLNITGKTYNLKELGKVDFKLHEIIELSNNLDLSESEINEIFFDNNLPFGR